MRSKYLKVLSFLLTAALLITSLTFVAGASEITVLRITSDIDTVELDGENDRTVTFSIIAEENLFCYNLEGVWDIFADNEYITLTSIESDVIDIPQYENNEQHNFSDTETGMVLWVDDVNEFIGAQVLTGDTLLTATYTISKDIQPGEYEFVFAPEVFLAENFAEEKWYDFDGRIDPFVTFITVEEAHVCGEDTLIMEEGQDSTCEEDGWKSYYSCSCGKYFEDAYAEFEIADLEEWKLTDGLVEAGHIADEAVIENETPATCKETGSYDEVVYCFECKEELLREEVITDVDPENHESDELVYTNDGDTHSAVYACCEAEYVTSEEHSYDEDGKCVCGAEKEAEHVCELQHVAAVAATCKENGNIEYWYCTDEACGRMYSDAECTEEVYDVTTDVDPENHESDELVYTNDGDNHSAAYACCEAEYVTGEDHFYNDLGECICGAVESGEEPEEGLKGDIDLDGDVDSDDLTLLARHVGGIESIENETALLNADVNEDGFIDSDDLTKHARFVGGIISGWDQE